MVNQTDQLIAQMAALTQAIQLLVQSNAEVLAALMDYMGDGGEVEPSGVQYLEDVPNEQTFD